MCEYICAKERVLVRRIISKSAQKRGLRRSTQKIMVLRLEGKRDVHR